MLVKQGHRWSEEQGTAIHEAGHAVVLFLEGGRFRNVSTRNEDGSLGRVHLIPSRPGFQPDADLDLAGRLRLEQDAMSTMAGFMAERRWTSRRPGRRTDWLAHVLEGADLDFKRAVDLAEWANEGVDPVAAAWLRWIEARVRMQLANPANWRLVQLLAFELLERKTLSWAQFMTLVDRWSGM
jgi:hypothetical protein